MAADEGAWQCAACTLINEASRRRCSACEGPPPWACREENSSGVRVVLSPNSAEGQGAEATVTAQPGSSATGSPQCAPKRPRAEAAEEECWACSACTLVNEPGAQQCAACGGRRWVLPSSRAAPRSVPAASAALRAARRRAAAAPAVESHEVPVGEWAALPPAPEDGPAQASAHDRDLDIFSEAAGAPEPPDASGPLGAAAAGGAGGADRGGAELRPAWGTGGQPLFAGFSAAWGGADAPALDRDSPFDDAVGRLAVLGFDPTKCHLALQAANGNEELARDFLVQNT
ncbi:unnamed protein product [Prorocentrum cordatum]|uniref:Ubiquitinyl hydrolase 1 n=1 Tax=Prorocentrum cordatum TaxID=2364126 RepID=A0ABN9XK19_9DINO|nr:unnamed protein product [Polarella glacialis]